MPKNIEERWLESRDKEIELRAKMEDYAKELARKYKLSFIAIGTTPVQAYYFIRSLRGEGKK